MARLAKFGAITALALGGLIACAPAGPVLNAVPDSSGIDSQATNLTRLCVASLDAGSLDTAGAQRLGFSEQSFNTLMRQTNDGRRISLAFNERARNCGILYGPLPLSTANVLPLVEAELSRLGYRPVQGGSQSGQLYSNGLNQLTLNGAQSVTAGNTFVSFDISKP